ncbi:MAG: T9SS type A sorting domain-containing protein [Aureispira sp.]
MKHITTLFLLFITQLLVAQAPSLDWVKSTGGTATDDAGAISTDAAGNIYTIGRFNGTVDFDPSTATFNLSTNGSRDVFIQKLSSTGSFIWAKKIEGVGGDRIYAITTDASNNLYLTGQFRGTVDFDLGAGVSTLTSTGVDDIFILKLDANGDLIWAKNMGQVGSNNGDAIDVDASGNVYVVGSFQGTVDFDPGAGVSNLTAISGDYDNFFLKLDVNGNFVWAKRMGNASRDVIKTIKVDASGNLHTTGYFLGTLDLDPGAGTQNFTAAGASADTYIQKLDNNGDLIWAKQLKGSGSYNRPAKLSLDASGNIYTTGVFAGVMDADPSTAVFNLIPQGTQDVFIHKLNANGDFIWAKHLEGNTIVDAKSIDVDAQGNVYTVGYFRDSIDLDPNSTVPMATNGRNDVFIQQLDSMGNFVWGYTMGSTNFDYGEDIHVSTNGDIHVTGYFRDTIMVHLASGMTTLASQGNNDFFVLKLKSGITTNVTTIAPLNSLLLFPNPTQQQLHIEGLEETFQGRVLDATGRVVRTFNSTTISVEDLATGIYYLQLQTEQHQYIERFIKS